MKLGTMIALITFAILALAGISGIFRAAPWRSRGRPIGPFVWGCAFIAFAQLPISLWVILHYFDSVNGHPEATSESFRLIAGGTWLLLLAGGVLMLVSGGITLARPPASTPPQSSSTGDAVS